MPGPKRGTTASGSTPRAYGAEAGADAYLGAIPAFRDGQKPEGSLSGSARDKSNGEKTAPGGNAPSTAHRQPSQKLVKPTRQAALRAREASPAVSVSLTA